MAHPLVIHITRGAAPAIDAQDRTDGGGVQCDNPAGCIGIFWPIDSFRYVTCRPALT